MRIKNQTLRTNVQKTHYDTLRMIRNDKIAQTLKQLQMKKESLVNRKNVTQQQQNFQLSLDDYNKKLNKQITPRQNIPTTHKLMKIEKQIQMFIDQDFFSENKPAVKQFLVSHGENNGNISVSNVKLTRSLNRKFKKQSEISQNNNQKDDDRIKLQTEQLKLNLRYSITRQQKFQLQQDSKHNSKAIYSPIRVYILPSVVLCKQNNHQQKNHLCKDEVLDTNIIRNWLMLLIDWKVSDFRIVLIHEGKYSKVGAFRNKYHIYQILLQLLYQQEQEKFKQSSSTWFPNVIVFNRIEQIEEQNIFGRQNGQDNFTNLAKLQFNLFQADIQLKIQQSYRFIRENLSVAYVHKIYMKKSVLSLVNFMSFYKKRSKSHMSKYFNLWAIRAAESNIQKMDEEIIDKKYCQQKYQRSLVKKVFSNWVKFVKQDKKCTF